MPDMAAPRATITQSDVDRLRARIALCWNTQNEAAQSRPITLSVDMNPDGTVARATVSDPTTFNNEAERRAAESAMRAMLNPRCQPFPLPPGAYEKWKTLTLTFDARDVFGGP